MVFKTNERNEIQFTFCTDKKSAAKLNNFIKFRKHQKRRLR